MPEVSDPGACIADTLQLTGVLGDDVGVGLEDVPGARVERAREEVVEPATVSMTPSLQSIVHRATGSLPGSVAAKLRTYWLPSATVAAPLSRSVGGTSRTVIVVNQSL